jgi:hypothetical protein
LNLPGFVPNAPEKNTKPELSTIFSNMPLHLPAPLFIRIRIRTAQIVSQQQPSIHR